MGSRYPSRLSFSRSMLRKLVVDNWKISKSKFELDSEGFGTVMYEIQAKKEEILVTIILTLAGVVIEDQALAQAAMGDSINTKRDQND